MIVHCSRKTNEIGDYYESKRNIYERVGKEIPIVSII